VNYNKPLLLIGVCIWMACANIAMAGFQFTAPVQQLPQETTPLPPLSGGLLPSPPDLFMPSPIAPIQQAAPVPAFSQTAPLPPAYAVPPTPLAVPQPQYPIEATPLYTPRQYAPRQPVYQQPTPSTGVGSLAPQVIMPAPQAYNSVPQERIYEPVPAPVPAPQIYAQTRHNYYEPVVTQHVTPIVMPVPSPISAPVPAPVSYQQYYSHYDFAVGFGNNLPLVTALEQVVPDGYAYVVADSVPMAAPVSWDGGRPWNIVLEDMLTPLNLRADISGQTVSITPKQRKRPVVVQETRTQALPQVMTPAAPAPQAYVSVPQTQVYKPAPAPIASPVPQQAQIQAQQPYEHVSYQQRDQHYDRVSTNEVPVAVEEPQPLTPASLEPSPIPEQLSVPQQQPDTIIRPAPRPVVQPVVMSVAPNIPSRPAFSAPSEQPVSRNIPEVTRGTWMSEKGSSLRSVLEIWCMQAGAELFWSSDYDYPLAGAVNISGTFEEAVETLLSGFEEAKPKPVARLHPNLPHGPAVLVVETRQVLD